MKGKCGIYKITNIANGKIYIGGSAVNINRRWTVHKSTLKLQKHPNLHLQRAWNKYGESSFDFSIIEECPESKVISREDFWMDFYDSRNRLIGYNLLSAEHHIPSKETRRKMSAWQKGKIIPENVRKKISESLRGREHSEETRRKISESKKGIKHSEKTKEKIAMFRTGKKLSYKTKEKIANSLMGNQHLLGHKHSKETRRKMSESQKLRKHKHSKETRRKISEALTLSHKNKIGNGVEVMAY